MNPVTIQLFYTLEEALLFSLVTIGVFVSFRLLKFPDLTSEGGFGFAAIMGGAVTVSTSSPVLGVCAGAVGGALWGLITALLANITKLPTILASILSMTMAVSAGLLITAQPNITVPDIWLVRQLFPFIESPVIIGVVGGFVFLLIIISALYLFCQTGMGFILRTRGENPRLCQELGYSLTIWDIIGLCMANAIVGTAAALFAQRSGYASIDMGRGIAIAALAAIMLGESIFLHQTIIQALAGCFLGTLILRLVRMLALNFGMPEGSLDFVTSLMVVVFYYVAKGKSDRGEGVLENIRM